jgi:hypothetical protein
VPLILVELPPPPARKIGVGMAASWTRSFVAIQDVKRAILGLHALLALDDHLHRPLSLLVVEFHPTDCLSEPVESGSNLVRAGMFGKERFHAGVELLDLRAESGQGKQPLRGPQERIGGRCASQLLPDVGAEIEALGVGRSDDLCVLRVGQLDGVEAGFLIIGELNCGHCDLVARCTAEPAKRGGRSSGITGFASSMGSIAVPFREFRGKSDKVGFRPIGRFLRRRPELPKCAPAEI